MQKTGNKKYKECNNDVYSDILKYSKIFVVITVISILVKIEDNNHQKRKK